MEDYKGEHEYTILFEETISKSFVVHAATLEEAKNKAMEAYKHADIVLESGNLLYTQCMVTEEDGKDISAEDDWEVV